MWRLTKFACVQLLLLVLVASVAFAQETAPCHGQKLSRREVKALIAAAKTAEEHHKLACYFRAEARSQEAAVKYHEEMAKLYELSSTAKHDTVKHCNDLVKALRKAAEADNQLAAEHEKMAAEVK